MDEYSSWAARVLGYVLMHGPCAWIASASDRVTHELVRQIFEDESAQPISCGLILRGRQTDRSAGANWQGRGE